MESPQHWVFRVHVVDRAGALTSIASAFSNQGISIDTVVGHGSEKTVHPKGSVVITFSSTREQKDEMARRILRLSKVTDLEERPYDSQRLRKSALVVTGRELKPLDVAGDNSFLTCETVSSTGETCTYFLAGAPLDLDPVLDRLEQQGEIRDIIFSIISL
jgi:acetolactate synthase small subunit